MKVSCCFFYYIIFNQNYSDSTQSSGSNDTTTTTSTLGMTITIDNEGTNTSGKKTDEKSYFVYFTDSVLSSIMTTSTDQTDEG